VTPQAGKLAGRFSVGLIDVHPDRFGFGNLLPVTGGEVPYPSLGAPGKALELILDRLDLTWTIEHGILLITTPEQAGS